MKDEISIAQSELLNQSKEQMIREYREGQDLIHKTRDEIAKAIASGSRFVPSANGPTRYHTKLQLIRSCEENCKDLADLYREAFNEELPYSPTCTEEIPA